LGGWPGTAAIQDGDTDWWYVEIPVDFTEDFIPATDTEDAKGFKLIFNGSLNGDDIQTGNILLENMTDVYITADSQVFDNEADAETAMAQPEGTLIISEYVEGSANNKALEIYNATGAEVDLTLYSLMLYANGDTETDMSYDLTGTLAAGETLVIVDSSADQALLDVADVTNSYPDTAVSFNGNDAITLVNDGTVIDVFGTVGEEGTVGDNNNWAIGDDAAAEFTLVRDPSVSSGVTVFDGSQWIVHPQDTFDKLGSHTLN
jgi:predicted extracellular nuclease